jgi:methyl-accepting chemotaxis protein
MRIGRVAALLASSLALIAVLLSALVLLQRLESWRDAGRQQQLTVTTAQLGKTLIDLSLERSLVQVTLSLPNPLSAEHAALIRSVREGTGPGFEAARAELDRLGDARSRAVRDYLDARLSELAALRRRADAELARPLPARDPAFAERWAREVPSLIARLEDRRNHLRGPADAVPVQVIAGEQVQHLAWAVREYGGRERTVFAIALALDASPEPAARQRAAEFAGAAERRLGQLEALRDAPGLDPELRPLIDRLLAEFRGGYARLRAALGEGGPGQWPIGFQPFFEESSRVLGLATELSRAAGQSNIAFWQDTGRTTLLAAGLAVLLMLLSLGLAARLIWFVRARVSAPAAALAVATEAMAADKLDDPVRIPRPTAEIARIAEALETLRARLLEARAQQATLDAERAARDRRQADTEAFTRDFSAVMGGTLAGVSRSIEEMRAVADGMRGAAEGTRAEAGGAARSSRDGAERLASAAGATEQMRRTAEEVGERVREANGVVEAAVREAEQSMRRVQDLQATAQEIGGVLDAIRAIARQTNLLALNATIEAARAGEAGKGFAVVAGEVKNLAGETARATEQVSARIEGVRRSAEAAAQSLVAIGAQIGAVRNSTDGIVAGMQAQQAAIVEVVEAVSEVADGSRAMVDRMGSLAEAADRGGADAGQVADATTRLGTELTELEREVASFLAAIDRTSDRRRFDRYPCRITAEIEFGRRVRPVEIHDVSEGGLGLGCALGLPVGERVTVRVAGGTVLPARIAREAGDRTGLLLIAADLDSAASAWVSATVRAHAGRSAA